MNMRSITTSMILLVLAQTVFATTTGAKELCDALQEFCKILVAVLPVLGFLLFVLAGVSYAAGQFFGAEMRGRASGWAMNMIVGAIIAFLLWMLGPIIINAIQPGGVKTFQFGSCAEVAC